MNMYMRAHGWRWKTLQDAKSSLTSNTLGRSAKEISEHLRPGITGERGLRWAMSEVFLGDLAPN